jgi:hypothetical protein
MIEGLKNTRILDIISCKIYNVGYNSDNSDSYDMCYVCIYTDAADTH